MSFFSTEATRNLSSIFRLGEDDSESFQLLTKFTQAIAFTLFLFGACNNSAIAGCGDYVILTGEVPEHLRMKESYSKSDSFQQRKADFDSFILLQDFSQKCSGPDCKEGQPTTNTHQSIILERETERDVANSSIAFSSVPESVNWTLPTDSDLNPVALVGRLDRPPQD